jgi:hypothetical protein
MSRTIRRQRGTNQRVRDGYPQYSSSSCRHHGSCNYCANNRLFSSKRRSIFNEVIFETIN